MLQQLTTSAQDARTWTFDTNTNTNTNADPDAVTSDWRAVDRALRSIAKRMAALDAEEARWLREAEALKIWRELGMVSAIDYMERVLGYGPRAAQDRLRVARALGALPVLTESLARGALCFSAVRELTRVATPATEQAWRDEVIGKNLRQVEELVANHQPGDRPDDPPSPEARPRVVRFELSPETFAALRQARQVLDSEHGSHLSDDQLVAAMCGAVLDGAATTEPTGRAKFQIAVTVCEGCRQGWQEGAGAKLAIDEAAVERALCDAQHIGSIDGDAPDRAYQDVAPSVARLVWRRDGGRCRVPGCRSTRGVEIHHLIHREHGGTHEAASLILCCSSCHLAHHRGLLTISGTAERVEVRRAHEPHLPVDADVGASPHRDHAQVGASPHRAHVGASPLHAHADASPHRDRAAATPSKLALVTLHDDARSALTGAGWTPAIASAAVATAAATLGSDATLEQLLREALRACLRRTQ